VVWAAGNTGKNACTTWIRREYELFSGEGTDGFEPPTDELRDRL
jgi:hypothetical protein